MKHFSLSLSLIIYKNPTRNTRSIEILNSYIDSFETSALIYIYIYIYIKAKQSHYRPGVAQRFPGS